MKLTNENINDYFTIKTKLNGAELPNVLIIPKGFPPINTKISVDEFNATFYLGNDGIDYNKEVKLWIMNNTHEGVFSKCDIYMYSPDNNPKTINTGMTVETLEQFI